MKRKLTATMLFILLAGGSALAFGGPFGGPGDGRHGCCDRGDRPGPGEKRLAKMAEVLELSDAQQTQIRDIYTQAREAAAPLREKMAASRKALHEAVDAKTFDEAKIRSLVAEKSAVQADLMIHRAQTRQQVYAILTPEQQQLYDKVQPLLKQRHGKGHWGKHRGPWEPEPRDS